MNKFYRALASTILIVLLWWTAITAFAQYQVNTQGVEPTFPYYNTLLEETSAENVVFAHFDGAHYLHLAKFGYDGTGIQAFFPAYPLLVRGLHEGLGLPYITAGRLISFISLVGSILCLVYLYGARSKRVIATLLLFPTSFYLAAMYTESFFLAEILFFFVLLKRRNYVGAAVIAGIASATRLVGVFLFLSLCVELWPAIKAKKYFSVGMLCTISISGFLAYALYLWQRYGDPLIFLHVQPLFGAERSGSEIVWLPQVLVRYGRMILTVDQTSWLYQRVWLELLMFLTGVYLWYKNLRQIPLSQSLFVGLAILLPTLSGTLSSFPRYLLLLTPFLVPVVIKRPWHLGIYLFLSSVALIYLLSRFATGQFVA